MRNFVNRLLSEMNLPSLNFKIEEKPTLLDIENEFFSKRKTLKNSFFVYMCIKKTVWKYVQHITSLIIKANKQTYVVTILRLLSR